MTSEVEGLAEKLVYIGAMLVAHCDKFPVPSHVLAHAATATQAAAALRAQAERVRVLEGELEDALEEGRDAQTSADTWLAEHKLSEARAEAAERRAGELEGALRKAVEHLETTFGFREGWECSEEEIIGPFRALLPATQAEGEK